MDRAKVKLADAATKAKGQAKGEVAEVVVVSAVPELKNNHPEVAVVLLQGKRFWTASEAAGVADRASELGTFGEKEKMSWRRGFIALVAAAVATIVIAGGAAGGEGEEVPTLQLEAKIPLGDVRGRIDHMAVRY